MEELLNDVITRYPNRLPTKEVSSYDLGLLVGQQEIIRYIASYIESKGTVNENRKGRRKL